MAVIWSPVRTLRRVAEGRSALPGLLVVAAYAALGLILSAASVLSGATRRQIEQQQSAQPGLPPGFQDAFVRGLEIGLPIFAMLSPFFIWISISLLMQLVTRFFNGTGPLSSMFGVVGVAQVPFFISTVLSSLVALPQFFSDVPEQTALALGLAINAIGLAFLVWYAVLVAIGAAQARNIGYGESAGSCAISCAGLAVLIILVAVILGLGAAIVFGAAVPQ